MAARPEPLADLPVSPLAASDHGAPAEVRLPAGRAARLVRTRGSALLGLSAVFSTPLAVFARAGHEGAGALATALLLGALLTAAVVYFATGLALLRARDCTGLAERARGDGIVSARSRDARAS